MTQKQVNKKYYNKYVEFTKEYSYDKKIWLYTVIKSYKDIRENTTLWQDVGTGMEYMR